MKNNLLFLGPKHEKTSMLQEKFKENNPEVAIKSTQDAVVAVKMVAELAPLVVFATDLKLMIQVLLKQNEVIKNSSSKTILFCTEKLDPAMDTKLSRAGLNDRLEEKTPDKTLYYKTSLYLKALPAKSQDDEFMQVKSLGAEAQQVERKKVSYIKDIAKTDDGLVEFCTEKGLVDNIVLTEFCDECVQILSDMETVINEIEDDERPFDELPKFSGLIDRIMGTATTLGLEGIFTFSELTKLISEHIMNYEDENLRNVVVAILGDATNFLFTLIEDIRKGDEENLKNIGKEGFITRLLWLSDKFKITTGDAASDESAPKMDQGGIDDLLASLGVGGESAAA